MSKNSTAKMAQSAKVPQPKRVSLKKNSVRVCLGLGVVILCYVDLIRTSWGIVEGSLLAAVISYYLGSSLWLRIASVRKIKNDYFEQICSLDAFVVASALAFIVQNQLISSVYLLLVLFQAMVIGGFSQALRDCGAYLIGAGGVSLLLPIPWSIDLEAIESTIVFMQCLSFVLLYGFYVERRIHLMNTRDQKLYSDLVRHKVRSYKLSRYVSPPVWRALKQDKDAELKTERRQVSVFFSDIAGFSAMSEEMEAEMLTELLNTYLTEMVKIAARHNGTIDKFMGDGLMVLFGDAESKGMKTDCLRCVSMAIEMQRKMKELETQWYNQGIKQSLKIRMGITSGYCTVGTFGTSQYMDYTVLGTNVNLASRLESAAEPGEILISYETWSLIKDVVMCRDRGEITAKGFSYPIKVYQVVDFRKNLGRNQTYFEERSTGFSMHLDTEKLKNYDKVRLADRLEELADQIRDK